LENLNKEIYNFNKLRKMTYEQLIENYKHGVKKGAYLPAYKTYHFIKTILNTMGLV
jgi:hypothetical protein